AGRLAPDEDADPVLAAGERLVPGVRDVVAPDHDAGRPALHEDACVDAAAPARTRARDREVPELDIVRVESTTSSKVGVATIVAPQTAIASAIAAPQMPTRCNR